MQFQEIKSILGNMSSLRKLWVNAIILFVRHNCGHYYVQPLNFAYIQLLNKPYENEVNLTGQNPLLKGY